MNKFEITMRYILVAIIAVVITVFTMSEVYAYTLIDTSGNYVSSEALVNGAIPSAKSLVERKDNEIEVGYAPGSSDESAEEGQSETTTNNIYSSVVASMTDEEYVELCQIVAAEAQTQCLEGQKAVVEVIFNRVLSPEWPNTVHGVLSQKGQFATWKLRNAKWVEPYRAVEAIAAVVANGRTVLPDTSYVYFDTKGINGRKKIKIQDHWFGRAR